MTKCTNYEYDVVLSFAGEDRKYVEKCASVLRQAGVKVFYDAYEATSLWGKDLYQHLAQVYRNRGKYAVVFISQAYSQKLWTSHELKNAQSRAFEENQEYILPARFDDTELPGLNKTIGFVDLRTLTPLKLARLIIDKLGKIEPSNVLPNEVPFVRAALRGLYKYLDDVEHPEDKDTDEPFEYFEDDEIDSMVLNVFEVLKKTSEKEREVLRILIMNSCWHDLLEDMHEEISKFERVSALTKSDILDTLKKLGGLGFEFKVKKEVEGSARHQNRRTYEVLHFKLVSLWANPIEENLTPVLAYMYLGAVQNRCKECSAKALLRLDFTGLDTVDVVPEYG